MRLTAAGVSLVLVGASMALLLAGEAGARGLALGEPLFRVDLGSCSYGGAAVADLDGDARPEVVFGTYYHDERVLAVRADGSILWQVPSGGGPVDNSVTVADLDGDDRPEVVWGNSGTTVLHVADAAGHDRWSRTIGEVLDAPKAVADLDGDGRLDLVVASCGGKDRPGGLRAFVGATGEPLWTATVGGCYQSAPLLFDQDGDGRLDVVVSTWFDNKVRAFSGLDGRLRWETEIGDQTYHAGSFGDLSGDGVPDVALGDFSATLWALDGRDGTVLWQRFLDGARYVFGPTAMGDLDGDGNLEIVVAGENLQVFDARGRHVRTIDLPGYCTRGPVLVDADDDGAPDVLVALDGPRLRVYRGRDGALLADHPLAPPGDMDFQPAVADLDGDGRLDVFAVYGRGQSDTPDENWGKAVALPLGGTGPGWTTFGHDHHHSGNYHRPGGAAVNAPTARPSPAPLTGTPHSTVTATPTSTPLTGTPHSTLTAAPTSTPPAGTPHPTVTATPTSTPSDGAAARPLFLPALGSTRA